jgi:hypothetical protein
MDLPGNLQFDLDFRAVDDLPSPQVPGYVEANARLAWRITPSVEVAIVGTDLVHARHVEFINPSIPAQEVPAVFPARCGGSFKVMRAMRYSVATTLLTALVLLLCTLAQAAPSLEPGIKATFLYKFVPFVEWPTGVFDTPASPVNICVFGTDQVTGVIDDAAANQRVEQRPIIVRHLTAVTRNNGCHVVYVAGPDTAAAEEALSTLRGAPVLTVTDSVELPNAPTIVRFVLQANRVSFDIDEGAAAQNALTVSSKLLSLARMVRPRR